MRVAWRWQFILGCVLLLFAPSWGLSYPDKYDPKIQAAAKIYLAGIPWRLYKSQLIQESMLNPNARSSAGAVGLAQFMPRTWQEVSRRMGYEKGVHPGMVNPAILAGAYYMATLRVFWGKRAIPDIERHKFALASYNAGMGNVQKAWLRGFKDKRWGYVAEWLHYITGLKNAKETKTYVSSIFRIYRGHPKL